jgi:Flp pilus assembly protein TadD
MVLKKKNFLTLFFAAPLFLAACNSLPLKSDNGGDPNTSNNLLNLLDPDIQSEEQALAKGEAALLEGKPDNALFYFVKTLQFNKNNIKALEKIASIHERGKHPEFAIKVYQDILAINGNHALANEKVGLYYLDKGQDGKAKPYLLQAIKSDKSRWKAYNGLGVIADLERNTEEAINYYQAALEIMPNSPMLLNNLGYSYYLSGDALKARGLFAQALNYDTQYKRAIHNLALIEIKSGEFTSAAMLFNRIMSPHESYNNIGYIALLNGQYDIAEEYLRRAIDESPVYFPKAQENLKNLMAAKAADRAYQPTSEEIQQTLPTPEIQFESDAPGEPEASEEPEENNTKVAQTVKPAPQKTGPTVLKVTEKKASKSKKTKAQQIAAQPAKKKTQPETKQINAISISREPSDRAPSPVTVESANAAAPAEAKPATQATEPLKPNPEQAAPAPELIKAETPPPAQDAKPQAVENKQPAGITEPPGPPTQPAASANPQDTAKASPALAPIEQKTAADSSPAQPENITPPAVSAQTAAPVPDQQQAVIPASSPPPAGKPQTANNTSPSATPASEPLPPSVMQPQKPVKNQEPAADPKPETLAPSAPAEPLKKNEVFVTDIGVAK